MFGIFLLIRSLCSIFDRGTLPLIYIYFFLFKRGRGICLIGYASEKISPKFLTSIETIGFCKSLVTRGFLLFLFLFNLIKLTGLKPPGLSKIFPFVLRKSTLKSLKTKRPKTFASVTRT